MLFAFERMKTSANLKWRSLTPLFFSASKTEALIEENVVRVNFCSLLLCYLFFVN